MTHGQAERHPRDDRRPGLRRPRLHREPVDSDAEHRPALEGVHAARRLPRLAALHADARSAHDGPPADPQRRLGDDVGPPHAPPRRSYHGRGLPRQRLPHGHVRQVAPRRLLSVPPAGPRLRDGRRAQGRRSRTDARLLEQHVLRRHVFRRRRPAEVRRLLHRHLVRPGDEVHRGEQRAAVLLLPRDERAARALPRRRRIQAALRRQRQHPGAGVLRHDHEHRREHGPADRAARRTRPPRQHDPHLHDRQRHVGRLPGRQGLQRGDARHQGLVLRRRPPRAVLHSLARGRH